MSSYSINNRPKLNLSLKYSDCIDPGINEVFQHKIELFFPYLIVKLDIFGCSKESSH